MKNYTVLVTGKRCTLSWSLRTARRAVTCTGVCMGTWPPLMLPAGPALAASLRGSAFGVLATAQAAANFAASAVAGILWTVVSPGAAFLFLAAAMLISVPLILASRRRRISTGSWPRH